MITLIVLFRIELSLAFLIFASFFAFVCVSFKCYRFIFMSKNLEISAMSMVPEITRPDLPFSCVFSYYLMFCHSMYFQYFAKANKHDYGIDR